MKLFFGKIKKNINHDKFQTFSKISNFPLKIEDFFSLLHRIPIRVYKSLLDQVIYFNFGFLKNLSYILCLLN